ncbi:MAG: PQQ-binding-like beta-propeller repeat protein [Verrucomicrobiales bacterium]|nr:PQQ-binding-like beta-propeller repeat protein [Verrucomicrobiae bacterium]MCP5554044.1 PQQ-binding-like beta-propeller repeat protein [Akkermansiaceae bacterium]
MKEQLFGKSALLAAVTMLVTSLGIRAQEGLGQGEWTSWRGPLQNGVSLETYQNGEFDPIPVWTMDLHGRGTPLVHKGQVYIWGYRGKGPDLEEVLVCVDEKSGAKKWEVPYHDYLSDTVYDRYTVGAPAVDPETGNIYVASTFGHFMCVDRDGKVLWSHSMVERFGRLTFPNGRAGSPVVDGNLVIIRAVTSYWGADGAPRDRFFGFDKKTGDLVWASAPGVGPPLLVDTSFSTPVLETRGGKRVFYVGTGCGNVACVNVANGKPLWRFQFSKGGVNSSVVLRGDQLIAVHGDENVDTSEIGRLIALNIPADLDNTGGVVDAEQGGAPMIAPTAEAWRNTHVEVPTSSPVVDGKRIYAIDKVGILDCVDAETGKGMWSKKLSNEQIHASPLLVDGLLYVPMHQKKLFVVRPSDTGAEIIKEVDLEGYALGSPAVANGRVYLHTLEKVYCFQIKNTGINYGEMPKSDHPVAGAPAGLMTIPSDVLLQPGQSKAVAVNKVDANGNIIGPVDAPAVAWEKFIPPTAKVKAEMDATVTNDTFAAADTAKVSAGMFKGTIDGQSGFVRGRVIPKIPFTENFDSAQLVVDHPTDGVKFAYPTLPWIGARFKWEVRELDGNKVLAKTLDRVIFQRSLTFMGDPDASNYTVQADVMTDGNRRTKSVVGLINQRYIISLVGNSNEIEVSSNFERITYKQPFPIQANVWYTLKTRVDLNPDGSGVVRGKAWQKGQPEPEAWSIEYTHKDAHKKGSPGLFGFSPQSQKRVYIDNISVTPNE